MADLLMKKDARISECGLYRYWLTRQWQVPHGSSAVFIMLNPSTADAEVDDRTIGRCIGFARAFGCGRLVVVNLFAFRATDPAIMRAAADPVGPDNNRVIEDVLTSTGGPVICAWGAEGGFMERDKAVLRLIRETGRQATALKLTKHGQPRHPLYLKGDCVPSPYNLPPPAQ